jgi:hypothetical protein
MGNEVGGDRATRLAGGASDDDVLHGHWGNGPSRDRCVPEVGRMPVPCITPEVPCRGVGVGGYWKHSRTTSMINLVSERNVTASEQSVYSSYREMLLEHLFAGAIMKHLWLKGYSRLEILKSQVDDSGYDLILEANNVVRHIQLKSSHIGSTTSRVNINVALARKPSGCVIWMSFDTKTLDFEYFQWFGGDAGEKLPDLGIFKKATHTKRNAQGEKTERPNIRIVPKGDFSRVDTIEELVTRLFGGFPSTVREM